LKLATAGSAWATIPKATIEQIKNVTKELMVKGPAAIEASVTGITDPKLREQIKDEIGKIIVDQSNYEIENQVPPLYSADEMKVVRLYIAAMYGQANMLDAQLAMLEAGYTFTKPKEEPKQEAREIYD